LSEAAIAEWKSGAPKSAAGGAPARGPWLDAALDTAPLRRRRAVVAGAATYKTEHDGPAFSTDPTGKPAESGADWHERPVIEELAGQVRVLCEEEHLRVALFVDRSDLRRVAKEDAVVRPAGLAAQKDQTETAPGLYLRPGAWLPTAQQDSDLAVELSEPGLRVAGTLPVSAMGDVFEDAPWKLPRGLEANLASAPIYASPGGTSFAHIGADNGATTLHSVWRLGQKKGFTLIRSETRYGDLVGWVKDAGVSASFSGGEQLEGRSGGSPSFRTHSIFVTIPRGTLLRTANGATPIGVMTGDAELLCNNRCFGAQPVVEIYACDRALSLQAMTPALPRPSNLKNK